MAVNRGTTKTSLGEKSATVSVEGDRLTWSPAVSTREGGINMNRLALAGQVVRLGTRTSGELTKGERLR